MLKEQVYEFVKGHQNKHVTIGFGSYGAVKLARNSDTKELVAIKLIYNRNAQSEIALHKQLKHPKIIKLLNYYYDESKNNTYMVLEYADGGTLFERIRTTRLKKEEIKKIFRDTCEAVQGLHHFNVMHRDIKPQNILLTKEGDAKLCDFGFASFLGDRKTLCGTYEYMAPEMIQKQQYDHKIDIWALGILLFEMIEGNAPFRGETSDEVLGEMKKCIFFSQKFQQGEINLVKKILRVRPAHRPTVDQILQHPFCKQVQQKKSIRTTVASEDDDRYTSEPISVAKSTMQFLNSNQLKLPTSPPFSKNIFDHRPISSSSHFYKDQKESPK